MIQGLVSFYIENMTRCVPWACSILISQLNVTSSLAIERTCRAINEYQIASSAIYQGNVESLTSCLSQDFRRFLNKFLRQLVKDSTSM